MIALAYFITWTTYGTWLPGDKRGHSTRYYSANDRRSLPDSQLDAAHAVNARSNHVHVVATAEQDIDDVMNQLKAWCSRKLSDDAGLTEKVAYKAGRKHWFTECGDTEEIQDEEHLRNAIRYVLEGQ